MDTIATVTTTESWPYAMSMDGVTLAARVESSLWTDGVVLASCIGPDERDFMSLGSFRGSIVKRPARSYEPASRTRWDLLREDGTRVSEHYTRREAVQQAGTMAVGDWSQPIRVRLAAIARAERDARRARIAALVASR